jgi:hypothetical protein
VPPDPHEEFEELCALSTTGELTEEEWSRLKEHLAHCARCRDSQRQFERVVATAIPALAEENGADQEEDNAPGSWSIEQAEADLMESLRGEPSPSAGDSPISSEFFEWTPARRYAAAALILATCGVGGYRIGFQQGHRMNSAVAPAASTVQDHPHHLDYATTAVASADAKTPSDVNEAAALRDHVRRDQLEMTGLKEVQSELKGALATQSADLDRALQERSDLEQRLTLAQSNVQSLQATLDLMNSQKPQDTTQSLALERQINNLNAALAEKDTEITREQELLQHDRDIRNLIGARNLYISEIYDIAKTGDTQKPFGRVFYTKDKSLIFYGYDLDKQRGVKQTSAFQAWGRRGTDRQRDVSLGLLYQDDASQKRWVLKFNDAKTIAQIDAVFVTVEPEGGSTKPSGKPMLFTYLRLEPNHP